MNWVTTLNEAISYIESRLFENLNCENIAAHVYISSYHFQRCFSLLTGMTVGEYIRNRRLSLAGQELSASDKKIIEIALKYGYETPESFAKAFSRFHGITPSQAKAGGSGLKSFNRLIIRIILEGGNVMDYRITGRESFKVLGMTRMFKAERSFSDLPKFWAEYHSKGFDRVVAGDIGICRQESLASEDFSYSIGCEANQGDDVPAGFEVFTIPAGTWAVFKCVGPMPDAIQEVWKRIYGEWLPQAEYERIEDYDFERYTEGNNQSRDYVSEIWIPVKRNNKSIKRPPSNGGKAG